MNVIHSSSWQFSRSVWTAIPLNVDVVVKCRNYFVFISSPPAPATRIPALLQWLFPVDIRPEIPIIPPGNGTINGTTESQMTAPYVPIITVPFSPNDSQSFRWECVFMPDNGAFFVNYVITSSFIGTALELVRLPELITYSCRIMCVRSQAEKAEVRKVGHI